MKKTDILDVTGRKLAPFMFLFGLYLLSYGHVSPGGGFQGGVVMASGIILLVLTHDVTSAEALFPVRRLSLAETATYVLLLIAGAVGIVVGVGFLGNFVPLLGQSASIPRVGFVTLLNVLIGVKVGAGISLICLHIFREQ